jgi:peptide/nickel transport system ATP-binding protein
MNLLTVESLYYKVNPGPREELIILHDINFNVDKDAVVGITGESGAGKTTLARIIAGHLKPSAGTITLNVRSNGNSNPVQLLYQNSGDIINPFRKALDIITEAAAIHIRNKKESLKEAERLLNLIQLNPSIWQNRGYELSGGQQQRVALARLLAVRPALLILDEPFAAQDIESQVNLLGLLNEVKTEFGLTIICISHNLKLLRKFADKMIILKEGSVIEASDTAALFNSPSHQYTRMLLKAEQYQLSKEDPDTMKDSLPGS